MVDVSQLDETKLKGTATVIPSGDMARKEWFDRNPVTVLEEWGGAVSSGASGYGATCDYTVPVGKKCLIGVMFGYPRTEPFAGGWGCAYVDILFTPFGGSETRIAFWMVDIQSPACPPTTFSAFGLLMKAGDRLRGRYGNWDTVAHGMGMGFVGTEFDA